MSEPRGKGRCLPEVAPEADDPHALIPGLQARQQRKALVRAAVVDRKRSRTDAPTPRGHR